MTTYKPPTELDRAALRAMGHRLPTGCDYQGSYPEAAEAATDLGADQDQGKPGEGAGTLIWPAVGAAALALLGYGVSLLLPLIKTGT